MQCLYLEINKGKLQIIATDAHRMFLSRLYNIEGTAGNHAFLIDKDQIKRLPKKSKEPFEFTVCENNVAYVGGLEIKLFSGAKFPDYKVVIPEYEKSVTFDRATFISNIKQVLPMTNKATNQVTISFNGQIDMSGQDVDFSFESGLRMPYIKNEIDDFMIAFNGNFLVECMNALDGDNVKMYSDGYATKAAIFSDGADSVLIMPLMLTGASSFDNEKIKPEPIKHPEPVEETPEPVAEIRESQTDDELNETVQFWKDVLDVHYQYWQNVFVHVYPDRISIRSISITDGELIKASNTIDMDAELAKQLVPVLAEIAQKHGKELIYKK